MRAGGLLHTPHHRLSGAQSAEGLHDELHFGPLYVRRKVNAGAPHVGLRTKTSMRTKPRDLVDERASLESWASPSSSPCLLCSIERKAARSGAIAGRADSSTASPAGHLPGARLATPRRSVPNGAIGGPADSSTARRASNASTTPPASRVPHGATVGHVARNSSDLEAIAAAAQHACHFTTESCNGERYMGIGRDSAWSSMSTGTLALRIPDSL